MQNEVFSTTDQWPPLWALVLPPSILAVSALVALSLLAFNVWSSHDKKRLDTILRVIDLEQAENFRFLASQFLLIRSQGILLRLNDPITNEERKLRTDLQVYLNHYEIVAIGIRNKILSRSIYKSWMGSVVARVWNQSADYIQIERLKGVTDDTSKYNASLYENFEWLAQEFSKNTIKIDALYRPNNS